MPRRLVRRLWLILIRGLLSFLYLPLLLDVFLLERLCLLLVLLLNLLLFRFISSLLRHFLVVLFLFLLELLPLLVLLLPKLLLLLLVCLIEFGVPGIGRSWSLSRWKVVGMDCRSGVGKIVRLCRGRAVIARRGRCGTIRLGTSWLRRIRRTVRFRTVVGLCRRRTIRLRGRWTLGRCWQLDWPICLGPVVGLCQRRMIRLRGRWRIRWLVGWCEGGLPGFGSVGLARRLVAGRPVVGVAGLPGGACFTIGCGAAVVAGRKLAISRFGKGCPGCAAIACCCFAKETGGGGGVAFAITCRFMTAAGGADTWFAVAAFDPSTACCVGATAALALTGPAAICCALSLTAAWATGCALANAC